MNESAKSQRRRVPRIEVSFPVTVNWGRKKFRWEAREFSEYGILLSGTNKELVGQDLKLEIALEPKDPPLNLEGIAVYAIDRGVGVRFKNLSPENQFSLKHYAQTHGVGVVRT